MRLCKKVFISASRQIKFGWRHLFRIYLPVVSAASPRRILFGMREKSRIPNIISRGNDLLNRGCVKSLLLPAAAEYSSERHIVFAISRSEIAKMTCLSKHNLARSAKKNLFTQPLSKFNLARSAEKILGGNDPLNKYAAISITVNPSQCHSATFHLQNRG